MGLLTAYEKKMGESVIWRQKTGVDSDQNPVYTDSSITVIWYDDVKSWQNMQGRQLQQVAFVLTSAELEIDDLITRGGYSWPVIAIGKDPSMGTEQMRKAHLGQFMI